jgi:hypothetical protein
MGWGLGRRRHGTLGLPDPRRDQQRLSWLDRDLRQRRHDLLRRQWKVLLPPVAAFAVAAVGPAAAVREHPLLLGGVVGGFLGAMVVGGAVWLNLLDGTLMARVGRMFERDVGRELRETAGVYGVVSDVSFESCNVDHVVLCPRGVLAVEVKGLLGRRQTLEGLHGRTDKLAQTRGGARKVQSLLRAGGLGEVTVTPVLVLAGPGVPTLTGDEYEEGVRVLAFRDSDAWRPLLAATDRPALLNEATARRAATVLLEHTRQRADHDRRQVAADRTGHAVPRQLRRRSVRISVPSS